MSLNIAKLLATLSQAARDQKLLAQGRLVNPGQMADLPFNRGALPNDAWLLVGELHPEMFALLMGGGRPSTDVTLMAPMATPNCSTVGQSNCSRQDGVIMRGLR